MESNEQILLRMKEYILLRGLSPKTLEGYMLHARIFLEYCNRPAEELNENDIRNFFQYLINEKKVSSGTVNKYNSAIRFLFAATLNRTLNYLQIPRQKKHKTLPEVLTREEVLSIIEGCSNIKHKAIIMVIYSSGLRVSEAAALRIQHMDSKNMRLFVDCGKGGKDRYTLLSETCLGVLRDYWKIYRPKHPDGWLFPGRFNVAHITARGIEHAFSKALKTTPITK